MNRLLLSLFLVVSLSGCSTLIESYLMKYDVVEYQQISEIRTLAHFSKEHCDNQDVSKQNADVLYKKTFQFKNYVEFLPYNSKVIPASIELDKMAQGLTELYRKGNVSSAFCKIKFDNVEKNAEIMQKTIGAKPR